MCEKRWASRILCCCSSVKDLHVGAPWSDGPLLRSAFALYSFRRNERARLEKYQTVGLEGMAVVEQREMDREIGSSGSDQLGYWGCRLPHHYIPQQIRHRLCTFV